MLERSHLWGEIHEQPAVISELLEAEHGRAARLAAEIKGRDITHAVIAARGTSDNAGRYAQYLFGAVNGLPVALATPSLHSVYRTPPRYEGALVLGISQSGKSPDIVSVLTDAREQGAVTAAMTNDPDSDLAVAAEHSLALHAGPERSVAATKTYTAELALVALLSAEMAGDGAMVETLGRIPAAMERTLQMGAGIAAAVERYRYMHACVVIGRGYNYATAFETALKIKELNYLIAEPYSSADFMHGPVALVEEAFPTMVIAPSGAMLEEMRKFAAELHTRGAEIIGVSDDPGLLEVARTPLRLPVRAPEWVSPLLSIIPGQLFAMHLAHARGYDVDRPRGLSKVTETR